MGILDIFDKFRDAIVLKEDCELENKIKKLEEIKELNPNDKENAKKLLIAKKGLEGEKEILYQLKKSNIGMYILHDVNLIYEDLKAQIDFILITPWCCYFIECKNLIGNIIVNEKGDFIREYEFYGKNIKKGMESPYRQVQAQREVYKKIWFKIQGKFKSFLFERSFESIHRILVVAANGENILDTENAPKDIKYNTIKADGLIRKLEYDRDHSNKDFWDTQKGMEEWANLFLNLNKKGNIKEELNKKDNNVLREKLIEFRRIRSKEKEIPAYFIFNNDELEKILEIIPKTLEELKRAKILSDVKINIHGKDIINLINSK